MDTLSEANGTFALNLLKKLGENNSKNMFISPMSISSALAMVFMGAKGNTATQISQALSFNKVRGGGGDVHQGFQSLLTEVNKSGSQYLLRTANRLFGEKSYEFLSSFRDSCRTFYQAEMEELNFANAAEESRNHINTWIADKTEGKITEVLYSGSVDSLTKLILVSAIYFKGNWHKQFNKEHTKEIPFKISKVENKLTYERFIEWTRPDTMNERNVEVFFPKFKLEENYDVENVLPSWGMADAFDQARADFSGMSSKRELFLSKVVHKAFVEVNEEGTEAAAATATVMTLLCGRITQRFCADHPFLFFIQHTKNNSILFCGRFSSPSETVVTGYRVPFSFLLLTYFSSATLHCAYNPVTLLVQREQFRH